MATITKQDPHAPDLCSFLLFRFLFRFVVSVFVSVFGVGLWFRFLFRFCFGFWCRFVVSVLFRFCFGFCSLGSFFKVGTEVQTRRTEDDVYEFEQFLEGVEEVHGSDLLESFLLFSVLVGALGFGLFLGFCWRFGFSGSN
jgi:hypothetical protein